MDLTRSVPFTIERAESQDGDGLTLEGYGAVFDSPTRIDSWEGTFDEVIARGAFARTLNAKTPVLQFDHGHHPMLGSIPIGAIESIREDDHGLYVRARLHDNWLTHPVRDAIASGAIDGMSFRFSVPDGKDEFVQRKNNVPMRTIREVKLYEVGPVVFPAYEATSVGVRSEVARIVNDPTLRAEFARALVLGTPAEGPADSGTPLDGPADESQDPPAGHSGMSAEARARVLSL
jgi:hypothetical protein